MARPLGAGTRSIFSRARLGRLASGREHSPFRPHEREGRAPLVVVQLAGIVAILAGLAALQLGSPPYTAAGVIDGVVSQLSTTLPASVSVLLAATLDVIAGAVLVRAIRWSPFSSVAEAVIAGVVGAVVKDGLLLLSFGAVGHFQPLVIVLVDLALLVGAFLLRPFVLRPPAEPQRRSLTTWILPIALWSIPVVIQLASPVVPYPDGLPNHVAPIEHLRTYRSFTDLGLSPAPEYGPAGVFLGYVSLIGSWTVLTDQPAVVSVSASILPIALVVMAAGYLMAQAAGQRATGPWILIAMPLSVVFLAVGDASSAVLALGPAAGAIALTVPERRIGEGPRLAGRSRPVLLAASLGATFLVHPLIGLVAGVAVAILALIRDSTDRQATLAAVAGAAIVALPQLAAMSGAAYPSWFGLPAWPVGLGIAAWLAGPGPRRGDLSQTLPPARSFGWLAIIVAAVLVLAAVGAGIAYVAEQAPGLPSEALGWLSRVVLAHPVMIGLAIVAMVAIRDGRTWLVMGTSLLAGLAMLGVAAVVPPDSEIGRAIHVELAPVAAMWSTWIVALAAGLGLAGLWAHEEWPTWARVGLMGVLVVFAAVPWRPEPETPVISAEVPFGRSAADAATIADQGGWPGAPDRRTVLDARGRAIVDAIRDEQAAGALRRETAVLHVAPAVGSADAVPIAGFTGVLESLLVEVAPERLPSDGSRIAPVERLAEMLGAEAPYLLVEGVPLEEPSGIAERAGYSVRAEGDGWRLFRLRDEAR